MKTIMGVDVNDGDRVQFKYRKLLGRSKEKNGYFYETKSDARFVLMQYKRGRFGLWNWFLLDSLRYDKIEEIRVIPEAKDGEN